MSGTRKRAVVVGVDGSDTSTAAALWAAGEAHARGAKLVVLYSYELYAYGAKDDAMPGSIPYEEAQLAAAGLVDAVVTAVQHARPGLEVEPRILNESAGTALLAASGQSLLTVVSSHGRSARAEELIGSFAVHTAEHGLGPVAVLRERHLRPGRGRPRGGGHRWFTGVRRRRRLRVHGGRGRTRCRCTSCTARAATTTANWRIWTGRWPIASSGSPASR